MTDLQTPQGLKASARAATRPPILDVLPPVLRRSDSSARCLCERCAPRLSEAQRAAHQRVDDDWRYIRVAWCEAHGYTLVDLIRAERGIGCLATRHL